MAIRIITDSTCDLSREDQARLGISVVPLTVHFPDASYLDGLEITSEEFYLKLDKSETLPTTSQVSPQAFTEIFKEALDAGDDVVGIFISSEISGTYQSACMAKEALASDRVYIIDSRVATMSLALLVSEAVKARDAGSTAAEIAEHVTQLTKKVRFLAAINTLKYLRKGGRISATTAIIGETLGMKPIVSMIEGKIFNVGKARGMPAAIKEMLKKISKDMPDLRYGVTFCISSTPEIKDKAIALFKNTLNLKEWLVCNIGSVIGTYAGRGVVGFAYIAK
jgi:DegV family protein with EDD domain